MKLLHCSVVAALGVGFGVAAIPASAMQDSACTGILPAGTYDNVYVPENASCTLNSSVTVQGNVAVEAGGSLTTSYVLIVGSILSNNASVISIGLAGSSTIGMNVTLVGTTGQASVLNSDIGGNLYISGSTSGSTLKINDNGVPGNVIDLGNLTANNTIVNNAIAGNLVCVGNSQGPTGGNLVVGGKKVGQCAGL
jgi:hypothetical protein